MRARTPDEIRERRNQLSLASVREARDVIAAHLPRTPLSRHPLLADELGVDLYLKHENHLPTGAFKIRGGINYMHHLPSEQKRNGIVTATRGNHGQSLAWAAKLYDVRCVILVPVGNNPDKNAAMRAFGAELIEYGKDFDEARGRAESLVDSEGLTFVHNADEPHLINGVGTYSLEIYEDLPQVDTLVIPVGGGSGICGAITVFREANPDVKIIGVQAENAPSVYLSWKEGRLIETDSANTIADGLATRVPFELPFQMLQDHLDDMVLVSEDEIMDAIRLVIRTTHNLVEAAAAAPIAAIRKLAPDLAGKTVAAPLSGANIDTRTLEKVLASSDS